jgi:hypothetical protein
MFAAGTEGRGIGTASLGKRQVFDPASAEQTGKALMAFGANRIVLDRF